MVMKGLTAADVMTREVITVSADATLREVAEILTQAGISGAPVVDADGRLVGIISESDLLNEEKRREALPRTALYGAVPVSEEKLMRAYKGGMSLKAWDLMTRDVITADEDTPADEVCDLMITNRVNRIPVVRDGKPVGIITRSDLLLGMLRSSED
ncbi:MAG: CBS domain-containing protein [Armatimonadota bacterium]|jgi:CBS domain-containing protein|nr:MAG: hypothetical protein KatS3mg024_0850 [Armatimonadota bacterium]